MGKRRKIDKKKKKKKNMKRVKKRSVKGKGTSVDKI